MKRALLSDPDRVRHPAVPHPPWPGNEHKVGDQEIFVRFTPATSAAAEPAVFVHGLGGSAQNWTDLSDAMSDLLEVEAIDLPGFGHSPPSTQAVTIPRLSRIVAGWIIKSGRGPVHLAGCSLGGAVAAHVAATRPALVRSLTLVSPAMPFGNPRRSRQSKLVPLLAVPGLEHLTERALAQRTPEEMVDAVYQGCWAEPERAHPQRRQEAIDEARRRLSLPWNTRAYIQTFRGLLGSFAQSVLPAESSLRKLAKRIKCPTLVIWGKQDRVLDVRLAPNVAREIPDSRLIIFDRCAHVAMMEYPQAVARAMVALFDEMAERERATSEGKLMPLDGTHPDADPTEQSKPDSTPEMMKMSADSDATGEAAQRVDHPTEGTVSSPHKPRHADVPHP